MKTNSSVLQKKKGSVNRKRYFFLSIALLLVVSMMLIGCSSSTPASTPATTTPEPGSDNTVETPAAPDYPSIIGIGTHGTGGTYYACGSGIAKVVSDHAPFQVTVMPTGGPNAYMPLLQSGELALGLMGGNDMSWAYYGISTGGYEEPATNLRALVTGHRVPTIPLVVRMDSGIKTVADLKGKRVGYGYGGNVEGHELITACLEAVGLTWDDVSPVPQPDGQTSFIALQEGRIDATFGVTPVGAQSLEIDSQIPLYALNFGDVAPEDVPNAPQEKVDILVKHLPASRLAAWEKQGILKEDLTTIMIYNVWIGASTYLSADAAYEICRVLWEYTDELHPQHVLLEEWEQGKLFDPNPYVPYHEGAVRFWKDMGVWTDEAEANQQALLAIYNADK